MAGQLSSQLASLMYRLSGKDNCFAEDRVSALREIAQYGKPIHNWWRLWVGDVKEVHWFTFSNYFVIRSNC